MKLLIIFLFFIYTLAPVITYSNPYKVKVYDLLNSNLKIRFIEPGTGGKIVVYPPNGYPIQVYKKPGPLVPVGEYRYFPFHFSDFYQSDVLSPNTWSFTLIQVGSRILIYIYIAYEFYDILNQYLQKYRQYNSLYQSFVDRNPGIGQGSFLALRIPFSSSWRLSVQGKTIGFFEYKNHFISVYEDEEFNPYMYYPPFESRRVGWGLGWGAIFMIVAFDAEYMNSLSVQSVEANREGVWIVESGYIIDFFGNTPGGPVSEAFVGVSFGRLINEYLENYPAINTFPEYLSQLQSEANQKAIKDVPPTSSGSGGKEIIGYYFPGATDQYGQEILPEGIVVPLGQNEQFERDLEEDIELCECPSGINLDVEPPPDVESQIPVDTWTSILDDLKNRFPFSIPFTYTYLISLMTIYTYSNIDIVNDIENKIKQYFLSAGYNININLDYIAPFVGFIRTLGTVLIILLAVVGYRRLLL